MVDNHGTAVNVNVPLASCRIKFRYSRSLDPKPILAAVQAAAERHGVTLVVAAEGTPPELPLDHPLIRLACALHAGMATFAEAGVCAVVDASASLQPRRAPGGCCAVVDASASLQPRRTPGGCCGGD